MKRALAAMLAFLPLAAACAEGDSPGATSEALRTAGAGPLFTRGDPRLSIAHRGVRRIEFLRVVGPAGSYREELTTDGHGRFAIEPVDSGEFADFVWEEFAMLQRGREGYVFRYRDVLVRDARLFARNWRTTPLGATQGVAGRSCELFRVERTTGGAGAYELAIDPETQLVLATREYDASGGLVATMTYESLDLAPVLDGVEWHEPRNAERALDSAADLAEELGARPLQPRLVPRGYGEHETSVLEAAGKKWLKLVYTNGIEPLFFLQFLPGPGALQNAALSRPEASSVVVFDLAGATAVQGRVSGTELLVVGKAPEPELLDLIESALP